MSDESSGLTSAIDTDRIVENIDFEELFEGTVLEGIEFEDDSSLAESIGRKLGEVIGRAIGEIIGAKLGAIVFPALLERGKPDRESDEESGESGEDDEEDGTDEDQSDDSDQQNGGDSDDSESSDDE